jgi:hypothetical protein
MEYRNFTYEIKPETKTIYAEKKFTKPEYVAKIVCTPVQIEYNDKIISWPCLYETSTLYLDSDNEESVKKEIDNIIEKTKTNFYIEAFKLKHPNECERLLNTYTGRRKEMNLYNLLKDVNYKDMHQTLMKEVIRRESILNKRMIMHCDEMDIREFRHKIEELTDNKVCVNGGKAYLHIYNWLYKDGKRTRYRCNNYYISIGVNSTRTEEFAKEIAAKCLEYAKIENYGQELVAVEKF